MMLFLATDTPAWNEGRTIVALAVIVLGLVTFCLYLLITSSIKDAAADYQQLMLAKVLFWWNYDLQQGDGLSEDYMDLFTEACKTLDITVVPGPPTPLHPEGTFTAIPSLASWLKARDYDTSRRHKP